MSRPDQFVCTWPSCGRTFSRAAKLADHLNSHQGIRPHQCNQCGKSFTRADHLKRHALTHREPTTPAQFECEICRKTFSLRHQLNRHARTHRNETKIRCEHCGETFTKTCKLNQHLSSVHQIAQPHSCPQCPKTFSSERQLRKHVQRHSKVYECNICRQIFPKWSVLVSHRRTAHVEDASEVPPLCIKSFKCEECGKVMSSKSALKVHILTVHQLVKPFKCAKCESTFGHKHLLQRHTRNCIK